MNSLNQHFSQYSIFIYYFIKEKIHILNKSTTFTNIGVHWIKVSTYLLEYNAFKPDQKLLCFGVFFNVTISSSVPLIYENSSI